MFSVLSQEPPKRKHKRSAINKKKHDIGFFMLESRAGLAARLGTGRLADGPAFVGLPWPHKPETEDETSDQCRRDNFAGPGANFFFTAWPLVLNLKT